MPRMNMVVVFGSSPESYYVSYGRRFFSENMPESFDNTVRGSSLPPLQIDWISMDRKAQNWVAHNDTTKKVYYSDIPSLPPAIRENMSKMLFVSFDESPDCYFIKYVPRGSWNGVMTELQQRSVAETRQSLSDFDLGLKKVLFGYGGTHIFVFENGYTANVEGDAENLEHPLHKILIEFSKPGWQIENGSSLCLYSDQYFFLKFRDKNDPTGIIQMRWNLPQEMGAKVQELRALADTPEEQAALIADEQLQMSVAISNMNIAIATSNALARVTWGF